MSKRTSEFTPVHLFHHFYRTGGGIERYGRLLSSELIRRGFPVVFHIREIDDQLPAPPGVDLRLVRVGRFPRKLRDYFYFRAIRRMAPELSGVQFALTRVPARNGEVCGGTHRGYLREARRRAGPFDRLQFWMEHESYHYTRRIVSHSRLCTRELIELYRVPEARICTLHPPVDDHVFSPPLPGQREELRKRLQLPADVVVFAFPSSGHRRKGLYALIEAMRPFSARVCLAVAGKPPESAEPWVRYLGQLEAIADLYRAADFTAMASYYEPFGLVGVESVLCGTPLLFERRIGCLEVVKPAAAVTFDVRNGRSTEEAVARAIDFATAGRHRLHEPRAALDYDPSPEKHVVGVIATWEQAGVA